MRHTYDATQMQPPADVIAYARQRTALATAAQALRATAATWHGGMLDHHSRSHQTRAVRHLVDTHGWDPEDAADVVTAVVTKAADADAVARTERRVTLGGAVGVWRCPSRLPGSFRHLPLVPTEVLGLLDGQLVGDPVGDDSAYSTYRVSFPTATACALYAEWVAALTRADTGGIHQVGNRWAVWVTSGIGAPRDGD